MTKRNARGSIFRRAGLIELMPLRFCMVTTFYPPYHFGGDAVFVRALSRELSARGHAVDVVHCEDAYLLRGAPPVEPPPDMQDGVLVHRLRSRFRSLSPLITQQTGRPGLKRRALRSILDQPFDVIHFHNISLIGGPAVLEMGAAPVKLYTSHEHWLVCPMHVLWKNGERPCDKPDCLRCCLKSKTPPQYWRHTGLIPRSLKHIDTLLAPSRFTANRLRAADIPCPIQVLPNFATMTAPPPASVQPSIDARARFLYVGRLTASKGVMQLAEQFTHWPQYDLLLAGEGELFDPLRALASGHPHIRLLGAAGEKQLLELYQSVTAVIVPSIGPEVFPLVPLEAMSSGTPVIVREAGGSAESVETTGGGVAYRTPDELAAAVHRIAADPCWRKTLAHRARTGYENHFTAASHLDKYLEVVETIRKRKGV